MRLTPEQQDALERETNLVVTAGAGTGKTEVMTQRILRVLNQLDDIQELLVVTFTEKAAGEIRQRLYQAILRKIREAEGEEQRRFERMRDRFSWNHVSTMHAFFADLIRRFPPEGVDPGYRVVEGAEKDALLRDVVDDLLDRIARGADHPLREDLRRWFRLTGSKRLTANTLRALVEKRLSCREWFLAVGREDYLALRRKLVAELASHRAEAFCTSPEGVAIVERLRRGVPKDSTDPLAVLVHAVCDLFDRGDVLELAKLLTSGDGKPRRFGNVGSVRVFGREALESVRSRLGALAERISRERFDDFTFDEAIEKASAECLQSLARLAEAAIGAYSRRKLRLGVLDFVDLEEYAFRVLENEEVLRRLRNQFRAIFVDEFQDTSRSQWHFFKRLATDEKGRFRENCLFIVGDAKQAIYAFRGGEVEVFELARREVGTSLGFTANFRSLPNLLAFTNRFFRPLLSGGELYEALAQDLRYQHEPDVPTRFVEGGGSVRHLVIESAAEENGFRLLEREAQAVAAFLRALCDGKCDADYGDIRVRIERGENAVGILFRRTTHQTLYEEALRAYGVRFVAAKGKGFFERQEIRDLRNALRFLGDPYAGIPLAGVLRSPLIGCSDDGLFLYATLCRKRRWSFAEGLWRLSATTLREEGLSDDDSAALLKAQELFSEWRRLARSLSTSALLSRLLTDSGVYAAYALGANGTQRVANVEKLVELAHAFESRGAPTLNDFLRYLDAHLESHDDEGDADLPDAGSIQLLTVHRAKGLQWPLVIVPDTNARFLERLSEESTPIAIGRLQERAEVALRYRQPDGTFADTALWRLLRRESLRRLRAEQKRLLYVAFTRAESHLVFCSFREGSPPPLEEGRSWADWIHAVLEREFRSEESRSLCVEMPAEIFSPPSEQALVSEPVALDGLWEVPSLTPTAYRLSDEPLEHRIQMPPYFRTPIAEHPEKIALGTWANRLLPLAFRGFDRFSLERRLRALMGRKRVRWTPSEVAALIFDVAGWLRKHLAEESQVWWNRAFVVEREGVSFFGCVDVLVHEAPGQWTAYDVKYGEACPSEKDFPTSYRQQWAFLRDGLVHVLGRENVRVAFVFAQREGLTVWDPK